VGRELGITTAALLGLGAEVSQVMKSAERLVRDREALSLEERLELMGII
jgi:hypothetical protein